MSRVEGVAPEAVGIGHREQAHVAHGPRSAISLDATAVNCASRVHRTGRGVP